MVLNRRLISLLPDKSSNTCSHNSNSRELSWLMKFIAIIRENFLRLLTGGQEQGDGLTPPVASVSLESMNERDRFAQKLSELPSVDVPDLLDGRKTSWVAEFDETAAYANRVDWRLVGDISAAYVNYRTQFDVIESQKSMVQLDQVQKLHEFGFSKLNLALPQNKISSIHEYLKGKPVFNRYDRSELSFNPSDPPPGCFVKCFTYLTDVDGTSGPTVYVSGSEQLNYEIWSSREDFEKREPNDWPEIRSMIQWESGQHRKTDAEIKSAYGSENVKLMTGDAGTYFLADTLGYHKGLAPTKKPRLILITMYSALAHGWDANVNDGGFFSAPKTLNFLDKNYEGYYAPGELRYMNRLFISESPLIS